MTLKDLLKPVVAFGLLISLGSCASQLFYTKDQIEYIDIATLEQYANAPEESPYTRSTQYGNKDQSTVSYILTSRKSDSLKIVVWKKNGIYTSIMRIEVTKTKGIRSRFDATGKLVEREISNLPNRSDR